MPTRRRLTIEDMHRVARLRGGRCLSPTYERDSAHLLWRCAEGHEWKATHNTIRSGKWCPVCAREPVERKRQYTQQARAKAKARGGVLLSKEVRRASRDPVRWRCGVGHEWDATWTSVRAGSWCPHCYGRVRFTLADAQALARSLGGECLSKRYVDYRSPLRWRSADGYEWRASVMSVKHGVWGRTSSVLKRGSIASMRELARERGGKCLSRRYENARAPLTWECSAGHRWEQPAYVIKAGGWCGVCYAGTRPTIGEMRELARQRGGKCLSTRYVNDRTKLLWRCRSRHTWHAPPNAIKAGRWCPTCATEALRGSTKPVYSLDDMKDLAARKGGKCLSRAYIDVRTPLTWRCASRHEWNAAPHSVRRGSWCPECDRLRRVRRKHYLAREREGRALARVAEKHTAQRGRAS